MNDEWAPSGDDEARRRLDRALSAVGPRPPDLGLTVRAVTELAEVSRSTVYRHWDTIEDLTADLIRRLLTEGEPLDARASLFDPGTSLADVVASGWDPERARVQMAGRMAAHAGPAESDLRRTVVRWEQEREAATRRWIDRMVGAGEVGDPPTEVVTRWLLVFLDGLSIRRLDANGLGASTWGALDDRYLRFGLEIVIEEYAPDLASVAAFVPFRGDEALDAEVASPISSGRSGILDRLIAVLLADPAAFEARLRLSRPVPTAVLARSLGVTDRQVESRWPTAGHLANDLWGRYSVRRRDAILRDFEQEVPALAADPGPEQVRAVTASVAGSGFEFAVEGAPGIPPLTVVPRLTVGLDPAMRRVIVDADEQRSIFPLLEAASALAASDGWRPSRSAIRCCEDLAEGMAWWAASSPAGTEEERSHRPDRLRMLAVEAAQAIFAVFGPGRRWDQVFASDHDVVEADWAHHVDAERIRPLAVALDLADRDGFNRGTLFTLAQAAGFAGVSRSTLYRHWATASEVNEDLGLFTAVVLPSWHRRVLEVEPAGSIGDVVDAALGVDALDVAVGLRSIAPELAVGSVAQTTIPAWERAWFGSFEEWWRRHLAAHGRQLRDAAVVDDAAIAFVAASLIEGQMLGEWLTLGAGSAPSAAATASTALLLERFVEAWTMPDPGAESDPGGASAGSRAVALPVVSELTGKEDLLGAMLAGLVEADLPPLRLVALGDIARALGVSERRANDLWPTSVLMNADIAGAVASRSTGRQLRAVRRSLRRSGDDPDVHVVVGDAFTAAMSALLRDEGRSLLDVVFALRVPAVGDAVRGELRNRHHLLAVNFQGLVSLVRPEAIPVGAAFERTVLGAARIVASSEATAAPLDRSRAGRLLAALAAVVPSTSDARS